MELHSGKADSELVGGPHSVALLSLASDKGSEVAVERKVAHPTPQFRVSSLFWSVFNPG